MSKGRTVKRLVYLSLKATVSPRSTSSIIKKNVQKRRIAAERKREYVEWFEGQFPAKEELAQQRTDSALWKYRPLISILVPLYNTPEPFLRDCIDSVLAQTYDNWELCLANDASSNPEVEQVAKEYAAKHTKIKYVRLDRNEHIVGASNHALKLATGEFIALLDHDDILQPHALYENVKALNANKKLDLIYSDEDKIDEQDVHIEPFFKPDWSPDFLLSCNYITHFSVLRRSIINEIGGFRYGTEGAQDWDLLLRFTEKSQNIHHIPKIIYSWRKSPTSTASAAKSKPYAYVNQKRVLREYLERNNIAASVFENKYLGFWHVRYNLTATPLVSIVIPTKDRPEYIKRCIDSIIEATSYPFFEIIVVDTGSTDPEVFAYYQSKRVVSNRVKIVNWKGEQFNFSSACNAGAAAAEGEYLLFLNNDTEILSVDWIEAMLEHAQRKNIGMVGCQLLFPGNNIQHAGVVVREHDIAVHPFYNSTAEMDIFTNIYISNIRNCIAVTAACSMVSHAKFDEVGGFNEKLRVTYNDVDLCLKLIDSGYRNIYTPYVEVRHFESVSVGKIESSSRDYDELEKASAYMREHWAKYLAHDPFYNDSFAPKGRPYFLTER